ncbi:MAG: hypothetical protein HQ464_06700, partial [Planctomycetes bacterium]|nr:hypothetical protein [Planctomycetota bacterium]
MPQTQIRVQPQDFIVQESELIFYYPKIVRAVGHDERLFPFEKIKHVESAKLITQPPDSRVRNAQWQAPKNPSLQQQLEAAAHALLHPTKKEIRTPRDAQRVLEGFVKWMDNSRYKYVSANGFDVVADAVEMRAAKRQKLSHHFASIATPADRLESVMGNKYNVFASASAPTGNCLHAATAFALLLVLNGFHKDTIKMCMIEGMGGLQGTDIFFKGEANQKLIYVFPSPKGVVAPACEMSGGRQANVQCKQLSPKDADRPFANHWIVKCDGLYYDPLYRCSYGHPDDAFDRMESVIASEDLQCQSPVPSVGSWILGNLYTVPSRRIMILKFESPRIQQLLGISTKTEYIIYKPDAEEDVVVSDSPKEVVLPHGLGRVFGYFVSDDDVNVNFNLMKAVRAYEKGCTGFFRSASPESTTFCKKARVFCGETATTPDNGKIYRPTAG